jgi:hypothetical protein
MRWSRRSLFVRSALTSQPELEIHGKPAALLRVSEEAAADRADESMMAVVAGVGFEPTTFRL